MPELADGEIDRDLQMLGPIGCRPAGFAQHPFADLDDEARFLGEGYEFHRRNEPSARDGASGSKPRSPPGHRHQVARWAGSEVRTGPSVAPREVRPSACAGARLPGASPADRSGRSSDRFPWLHRAQGPRAASAHRRPPLCSGASAMPMLQVTCSLTPSRSNGVDSDLSRRSAKRSMHSRRSSAEAARIHRRRGARRGRRPPRAASDAPQPGRAAHRLPRGPCCH